MFNKYYQDELSYLRELGKEFAAAYPAIAPMLAETGGDPDVELDQRLERPVPNVVPGKGSHVVLVIDDHTPPPVTIVRKTSSGAPGVPPVPRNRKVMIPPFMSAMEASYW